METSAPVLEKPEAAVERARPLMLAVASGKGGVGKTMLTVACAYELSLGGPTLVIDLDFFNRGLSGLFRGRKTVGLIARPRFLDAAEAPPAAPWELVEVDAGLFHIAYPDLVPDELVRLENHTPEGISGELQEFIERAAELCGARAIVLDCHGGPDHTSFAAALLADYTLLVSEPDRITLHGTLNFLRQLRRGTDCTRSDVRLVFNKVVPAFRPAFLRRFYDDYLREAFAGHELLAKFPLELNLTKAFEETPLISRVYPYSHLACKMRVLLLDLLGDRSREYLAPSAQILPQHSRNHRRRTLGKIPWFVNHEFILQVIAFALLVMMLAISLKGQFVGPMKAALFRGAILAELVRHPEIHLTPADSAYRLIKDPRPLADSYSFGPIDVELAHRTGDYSSEWKMYAALKRDGRSLFAADAEEEQDWRVSDYEGKENISVPKALAYFLDHFTDGPAPAGFEKEWREDVKVLKEAGRPNLRLVTIVDFLDKSIGYASGALAIWLGIALYIDWNRRLNVLFVRLLHSNPLLALAIMAVWLALWTLPVLILAVDSTLRPTEVSGESMVFWALVIPYSFIVVRQGYRCYRLWLEGRCDSRRRSGTADSRAAASFQYQPFVPELSLRLLFIVGILGMLAYLWQMVTRPS